jgi:hypothetical protein
MARREGWLLGEALEHAVTSCRLHLADKNEVFGQVKKPQGA